MVPWAHPSPQPNQHLDRLRRFCRAHYCDRLTDRPTGHNTQLVTIGRIYKCSTMMRPNNSTGDNVYGAVIMARPLQSSPGSFDECRLSDRWLPILKPSQPGCYHLHPQSPFIIITQPERADTHFTIPLRVEGWIDQGTAVRVHRRCPRLYIMVAVVISTSVQG